MAAGNFYYDSRMAIQEIEVQRHKYFLSKTFDTDIRIGDAYLNWSTRYAKRFARVFEQRKSDIEKICEQKCNKECKGRGNCPLPLETVRDLLGEY